MHSKPFISSRVDQRNNYSNCFMDFFRLLHPTENVGTFPVPAAENLYLFPLQNQSTCFALDMGVVSHVSYHQSKFLNQNFLVKVEDMLNNYMLKPFLQSFIVPRMMIWVYFALCFLFAPSLQERRQLPDFVSDFPASVREPYRVLGCFFDEFLGEKVSEEDKKFVTDLCPHCTW